MVSRKSSSVFSPFFSVPAQRIRAVTNATSLPAVTFISRISKTPEDQEKNRSHVFRYSSIPLDTIGGGTSNIRMSGEWCARIPSRFLARTAAAQFSTSSRIAAVSFMVIDLSARRAEACYDLAMVLPTFGAVLALFAASADQAT